MKCYEYQIFAIIAYYSQFSEMIDFSDIIR